jgi:hypothetical protein
MSVVTVTMVNQCHRIYGIQRHIIICTLKYVLQTSLFYIALKQATLIGAEKTLNMLFLGFAYLGKPHTIPQKQLHAGRLRNKNKWQLVEALSHSDSSDYFGPLYQTTCRKERLRRVNAFLWHLFVHSSGVWIEPV